MKQTEKYGLNLLESSDPLSVKPINDNTETIEQALSEVSNTVSARTLIACGRYTGTGTRSVAIQTPGFKPRVVLMRTVPAKVGSYQWGDTTGAQHFEKIMSSIGVEAGWCIWTGYDMPASYEIQATPRDGDEPTRALVDTTIQFTSGTGQLTWRIGNIVDYDRVTYDDGPTSINNKNGEIYEWIAFGVAE